MLIVIVWPDSERPVHTLLMTYFTWRQLQGYKKGKLVLRVSVNGFYHHFKNNMSSISLSDSDFTSAKGKKL